MKVELLLEAPRLLLSRQHQPRQLDLEHVTPDRVHLVRGACFIGVPPGNRWRQRGGCAPRRLSSRFPSPPGGTLHPTPYTLHPAPHTLHPTPHTPHPTPHTLHFVLFALEIVVKILYTHGRFEAGGHRVAAQQRTRAAKRHAARLCAAAVQATRTPTPEIRNSNPGTQSPKPRT